MLNNFDIMWVHVNSLIDKLLSSEEMLTNDELYSNYCNAFNQLIEIAESEPDTVSEGRLEEIHHKVKMLENAYVDKQKQLQESISLERLKARTQKAYLFNESNPGYDKSS